MHAFACMDEWMHAQRFFLYFCLPFHQTVITSLDRMLETALELDTGRYSPGQSPLILYIIRLVVRVEGYLLFLRDDQLCWRTRGLRREDR